MVLVNDHRGQDLPALSASLAGLRLLLDGCTDNYAGALHCAAALDFFNPRLLEWEPLLEPWAPTLHIERLSGELHFKLVCNGRPLDLDVSPDFLRALLSTLPLLLRLPNSRDPGGHFHFGAGLLADGDARRDEGRPPFLFRNATGHALQVRGGCGVRERGRVRIA